jgi:hypothetical protein
MIYIEKGVVNSKIITTLKEKQTLSAPYYLFRFISEGLNTEATCVLSYTTQTNRCEKFSITEGTTVTLPFGISEYRVYEQTSSSNQDFQNATNTTPIEIGLAMVTGNPTDTYAQPIYLDTFAYPS